MAKHRDSAGKETILAKLPEDYVHSSARFYELGEQGIYEVMHANDWINEHWFNAEIMEIKFKNNNETN